MGGQDALRVAHERVGDVRAVSSPLPPRPFTPRHRLMRSPPPYCTFFWQRGPRCRRRGRLLLAVHRAQRRVDAHDSRLGAPRRTRAPRGRGPRCRGRGAAPRRRAACRRAFPAPLRGLVRLVRERCAESGSGAAVQHSNLLVLLLRLSLPRLCRHAATLYLRHVRGLHCLCSGARSRRL